MFGIKKQHSSPPMSIANLFLVFLVINQLLTVQSFRLMHPDVDVNDLIEFRRNQNQEFPFNNVASSEDLSSISNDDNRPLLQAIKLQRRFCCMPAHPIPNKRSLKTEARRRQAALKFRLASLLDE